MTQLRVEIVGAERLLRQLTPGMIAQPMRRFLSRVAIDIESGSKKLAPVDTGRLRSSITHKVDPAGFPGWATVGTNVSYAAPVHEGARAHFPPPAALAGWARRHGMTDASAPFLIARAISRRGQKPKPFLKDAVMASVRGIGRHLGTFAAEIRRAWDGA